MDPPRQIDARRIVHFGAFEADLHAGELWKYGIRIKVNDQPFRVLELLLERPGGLVTREELKQHLWPGDTYVDFDRSLNAAVKNLRGALGDSPRNPRFIETLPKRGYRFVAPAKLAPWVHGTPTETPRDETATGASAPSQPAADAAGRRHGSWARPAMVLAVVLLSLGGAVWWQAASNPRAETLGSRSERLLDSFPYIYGEISPDGRYLAYSAHGNHPLRLRDLRSKSDRLLVTDSTFFPFVWSADSKRLALVSRRDGVRRLEILDIKSGERQVLREGSSLDDVRRRPMAWDAEGNRLLCGTVGGDGYGFLSLRDLTLTPLTMPRSRIYDPALSPDGRFLAYSYQNGKFWGLELVATNGEHDPIQLTAATRRSSTSSAPRLRHSPSTYDRHAFWAPDGRTLLFIRGYGVGGSDRHELWALGIDSAAGAPQGAPFQLAELPHHFNWLPPTLTPDGEVLFARRKSGRRVHLLAVDPESGEARGEPESDFPEDSQGKHWAPQGMKFYYFDPSWQVISDLLAFRERDVATGKERIHQIPWPELSDMGAFYYSRDHSKGLFVADAGSGKGRALHLFNAETHELSELLALKGNATPQFSHDVKKAAFFEGSQLRKEWELKVVDLTRGSVRTLIQTRGRLVTWPRWSPDDTEIAYTAANCLYAVLATSGQSVTIACGPPLPKAVWAPDGLRLLHWHGSLKFSWSPGGRMLVWAVAIPEKRRVELWVVDRDTGKHRVAWAGGEAYSPIPLSPEWSPDGKLIAFTMVGQAPVEVWAMRNSVLSGPRPASEGSEQATHRRQFRSE